MSVLVATSRDRPPPARPPSSADTATALKTRSPRTDFRRPRSAQCNLDQTLLVGANYCETEMCSECGISRLVRNGTCMKCDTCGGTML
jgi:hypothetical protein